MLGLDGGKFLLENSKVSIGELKEGQAAAKGGCPLQAKTLPLAKSGVTTMELEPSIQSDVKGKNTQECKLNILASL